MDENSKDDVLVTNHKVQKGVGISDSVSSHSTGDGSLLLIAEYNRSDAIVASNKMMQLHYKKIK